MSLASGLACVMMLGSPAPAAEVPAPAPAAEVADPFTAPSSTAPASAAPLDDERPESSGLGLQRQLQRKMEDHTGLDLEDAWDDYEEDYKENGERRDFARYTAQRFRNRRGGGIALTIGGLVLTGGSSIFWIYVVGQSELGEGQAFFSVIGVGVTAIGIAATSLGGVLWARNQRRLENLREGGYRVAGTRMRLRAVTPLLLRGGGGLGLRLAF